MNIYRPKGALVKAVQLQMTNVEFIEFNEGVYTNIQNDEGKKFIKIGIAGLPYKLYDNEWLVKFDDNSLGIFTDSAFSAQYEHYDNFLSLI